MKDCIIQNNLETLKHIQKVRENLFKVILELEERGKLHDASKMESPEQEIFGENYEKLAKTEYGTEEYSKLLEEVKPALDNHYAKNKHHPQHWPNGIEDMSLVDILEMLVDWISSTERVKAGNIHKSIEINSERFKINPQLAKILRNTVDRYF